MAKLYLMNISFRSRSATDGEKQAVNFFCLSIVTLEIIFSDINFIVIIIVGIDIVMIGDAQSLICDNFSVSIFEYRLFS